MLADIHNHTKQFSPDAQMDIGELLDAAVKRGLDVVGVTEHFEYDNPDPMDIVQVFDMDEYERVFGTWKDRCPDGLKLIKGIEFGYQSHTAADIDEFALKIPFDVVILSNHIFGNRDVYYGGPELYDMPKKERHAIYIGKMAEMCERCNNYNVAAHFDYINRYNPDTEEYLLYDDCPEEFDRFLGALAAKDKCLEINTRSIYKAQVRGCSRIMPDERIIRRYLELGGRLISLGSDSHTPDTLGVLFDETIEYLNTLGVKELCYFINREPVLYGI
ncbi:histidinol-phosphatase (PHP family) [Ruminococcaceae bacterium YRB3002]|nr:histidinol-phosphatase (PHP family) [Ruminococcaceae bacterium YRB3002]